MSAHDASSAHVLNALFERVYVCHLERLQLRREHLAKELAGLEYQIWPGVDGAELDRESLIREGLYDEEEARRRHWKGSALATTEIGCSMTHLRLLEDVVEKGHESVLVLEDDVQLRGTGLLELRAATQELPADWDMLYLGYWKNERMTRGFSLKLRFAFPVMNFLRLRSHDLRSLRRWFPREHSSRLMRAGYHYGSYAYAVSQRGAQRLLAFERYPIRSPIDVMFGRSIVEQDVQAFIVKEKVVEPAPGLDSLIEGRD